MTRLWPIAVVMVCGFSLSGCYSTFRGYRAVSTEVPGKVLMLGRTIPAAASNRVDLVVDGGTPCPILRDGHNRSVAKGLNAGPHRVAVVVQPFGGGKESADKVQIWWGGGAGLK